MSVQLDSIERLIGRLYTAFILRDLTFLISGAIVFSTALSRPVDLLAQGFSGDANFHWLAVPAFFAISYVLGVLLQEAARIGLEPLSKWWIRRKLGKPESPDELVVRLEAIRHTCSEHTINGIERILFLKQIAATQFSAFAALTILLPLRAGPYSWWLLWLILLLSGMVLCAWIYSDKSRQQESILTALSDRK